ncbi:hypothetical protein [Thermoleptolyngbya sp. M55_K2018_002]|uniref:hypothetical protein n=1 Tax=Thermoleptolyngbya sp. M55_K2018_002 TaxID=2747808 RepID=UPI001A1057CF|nr:hypothetical protein [Thermoleptolyngbya sp. M55_K2018_002]HIK41689.1 hypothetical protein [Thermoleptolyngbya sp. M55_K2018_002]
MLVHLPATDPLSASSSLIHRAEFLLQEMALLLKIILEFIAIGFLGFGRFLAGAAREKSSNCVSPRGY